VPQEEIKTNYHSFLGEIKEVFDPILHKMRNQADPEKWKGQAWLGPLHTYKGLFKSAGALGKVKWAALPLIGPVLFTVGSFFMKLPLWSIGVIIVAVLFLLYWALVVKHTSKMASIGDPNFHIGAFKATRPKEYAIWSPFFQKHNATFTGLHEYVNQHLHPQSGAEIKAILEYTKGQTDALLTSKEEYRTERDYMIGEVERYEKAVGYLVDIIKAINKSLYRLTNNCMDFHELDFVCPFTIYEVDGDVIRKRIDRGTSGSSPEVIPLVEENAIKYAAVDVALHPDDGAIKYNNPYPNRTVVAYRMKMLNDVIWIWNFHFDDSNHKALSLTLSNDIIEIGEVYRLVHAFCLILQKRTIGYEEGTQNGNSTSKAAKES
jgi:hypothetical protein